MNMYNVQQTIRNAIDNNTLIHFSHTDLDGYGCHLVTRKAALYTGAEIPITYNSEELGDKFQDFLEKVITLFYSNNDDKYTFLVTDIGELDIIGFANRFKNIKLNLIVIDHHKISDMNKVGEWYYEENGFTVYYNINETGPNIHYIHTADYAATWIYANVIGLESYKEFYYISEYDCGRWEEWRLDKTHTPSIMTKLNQGLQIIKNVYAGEKDSDILNYLSQYVAYLMYEYFGVNKFDVKGVRVFGKAIDHMVNTKCNENTRLYYKWVKSLNPVTLTHYQYMFSAVEDTAEGSYTKQVMVKFPKDQVYLGSWVVLVQTEKDEGPFSVYAKQYLEEHPNINGIIKYTPNFKDIVSLRSASDEIDVSKIAVLNGGGGHPRAAGFMAKPEILM